MHNGAQKSEKTVEEVQHEEERKKLAVYNQLRNTMNRMFRKAKEDISFSFDLGTFLLIL